MNQAQICNLQGKTVASAKLLRRKCFFLQSAIKNRLKHIKKTYVHKRIPVNHADAILKVINIVVSERYAIPVQVAFAGFSRLSIAILLDHVLYRVQLRTTVKRVHSNILAFKAILSWLTNDRQHHLLLLGLWLIFRLLVCFGMEELLWLLLLW